MSKPFDLHHYDDIIDLPHHTSPTRPKMSAVDRGAQFSPFAALTGYEAAVEETARLTERQTELSEDMKSMIDEKLRRILEHIGERPQVTVTRFLPDERKEGGAYVRLTGIVRRIDSVTRTLVMEDKTAIPIPHIRDIDGPLFADLDFEV